MLPIWSSQSGGSHFEGKGLYRLEHLTRLSLVGYFSNSRITQLVHLPDSILVCIFHSRSYGHVFHDNINDIIPDPRVVIPRDHGNGLWRSRIRERHYPRQWEGLLDEDELDMWDKAEKMVKARRAKLRPNDFHVSLLVGLRFFPQLDKFSTCAKSPPTSLLDSSFNPSFTSFRKY
ncbi:hypothetical protein C8J56DRAFT_197312 [Mycena floridula]|nr:hypothetical protein C8J56DRAFT_197312 [Mycena floridula]